MGGMELLARMRAQRAAGGATGGAASASNPSTTANENVTKTAAEEWTAPKPTNSNRTISLDVCGGVDCAGHGGAAALIELEELAGESPSINGDAFTVARSPCMRLCGHGPSVRLHVTLELEKDAARVTAGSGGTKVQGQTPQVGGDRGEEEVGGDAQALHAPAQCTLAVEHLTKSPLDCRRVLEVAREMAERTAAMVGPLPSGVRPDEWRGAEEDAALSSLQWRPSDARGGDKSATGTGTGAGTGATMDHRTAIMSRRAENMRWEALKVITRRDGAKKGAELLDDANRADVNVGRMIDGKTVQEGRQQQPGGGGDGVIRGAAVARAERRAARLAELTSRPVAEPLPSEGAVEGGVKEIIAGMAALPAR